MSDLLKPLSENEAYYKVNAQATYFPHFIRVFIPTEPFDKLKSGLELRDVTDLISNPGISLKENNLERALRRARKNIKDLIFCNEFDHFATWTFKTDRKSPQHCKDKLSYWVKNEKKRKGNFDYLIVPEFHKDKEALHLHGLLKGYKGEVRPSFSPLGRPLRQNGRRVHELPSFRSGFTNVKLVDKEDTSSTKLGFYLQKYLTKDMPILFGKNRYWASSGLLRPVVEYNPEPWYECFPADRLYENEFGQVLEFDQGSCAIVDMFLEANKPKEKTNGN